MLHPLHELALVLLAVRDELRVDDLIRRDLRRIRHGANEIERGLGELVATLGLNHGAATVRDGGETVLRGLPVVKSMLTGIHHPESVL